MPSGTPKTSTQLDAVFANNSSGDISASDMRDFVATVMGGFAQIYVHDGSTAQSSIGTSPALFTGFATNGVNDDAVADQANDRITLTSAGTYLVQFSCSFTGTASTTFQFHGRLDAVEQVALACQAVSNATPDAMHVGFSGIVTATAGQQLTVYVEANAGSKSITPVHASLSAKRIG